MRLASVMPGYGEPMRDHEVRVQRNTPTQSGSGFETEVWSTVKTVYAGIEPLEGREMFAAQTFLGSTSARIVMRYDPVFDLKDTKIRLVDIVTGEVWEVESVIDKDNRRWALELMAKKVVGGGQP